MEFTVLETKVVGPIQTIDETTKSQYVNVTVGVVDCPHDEISVTRTIAYTFSTSVTVQQAEDGLNTFIQDWLVLNYPSTIIE